LEETNRTGDSTPFFSICIPQYNRTRFLIEALQTFAAQSFRDFEVCISDDCSTDGGSAALLEYLRGSGLSYIYSVSDKNLRYDGNLRRAISLSRGRYLWLMGNDDGLTSPGTLEAGRAEIVKHSPVAVAISNYREAATGYSYQRMLFTGVAGSGPTAAVEAFRRYSFVSGVILDGPASRALSTSSVDGAEMYQMYLATRLVGAGGRLLSIDETYVDKDLQVPNEQVDSYRLRPKLSVRSALDDPLPMTRLLEVVAAGLEPCHSGRDRDRNLTRIALQLYTFIYPFWVVEYRSVQSWGYALGLLLSVRPSRIAGPLHLSLLSTVKLWTRYLLFGGSALLVPRALFQSLRARLFRVAKRLKPA
jgi:hypothetical protein